MKTIIFSTAIRLLTPVFLMFSVYILLRGHNHPGGGFVGGLIGAIAFVFHVLAHGPSITSRIYFTITYYHYPRKSVGHSRVHYAMRIIHYNILKNRRHSSKHRWNFMVLRVRPVYFMGLGLMAAVLSGTISLFFDYPFMTGLWLDQKIPVLGVLGTPLLFDLGVYLLVMGMILKLVFSMSTK